LILLSASADVNPFSKLLSNSVKTSLDVYLWKDFLKSIWAILLFIIGFSSNQITKKKNFNMNFKMIILIFYYNSIIFLFAILAIWIKQYFLILYSILISILILIGFPLFIIQ
jgi:hypothetical protein